MFNTTMLNLNDSVPLLGRTATVCCLAVTDFVAIIGNGFFIFAAFSKSEVKQFRTYVYMASVSIANLGVALFVVPFKIVTLAAGKWVLGPKMCYVTAIMLVFWLLASLYTMTALSIHKYFSIARPLIRQHSFKYVAALILCAIFISVVVTIVIMMYANVWFDKNVAICTFDSASAKPVYLPFILLFGFILPTIVTVVCYWRTVVALQKHAQRMKSTSLHSRDALEAQRKISKSLLFAFVLFMVSWTPFFVYMVFHATRMSDDSSALIVFKRVAYFSGLLSCALNPIIYIWRSIKLRKTLSSIFKGGCLDKTKFVSSIVFLSKSMSSPKMPTMSGIPSGANSPSSLNADKIISKSTIDAHMEDGTRLSNYTFKKPSDLHCSITLLSENASPFVSKLYPE